ncbi:MAG: PrsW family intramembrane metalloprotease [Mogibacterium sp.]|nr:PrsW family intramembrane metalloprotease [Mogibacterium sp.]
MSQEPIYLLLILALAPPLVLLYRVYKLDKIEKEPPKLIAKLFLFGVLSTIPAAFAENFLINGLVRVMSPYSYAFIFVENFFCVALVEELVKYVGLKLGSWKHPAFDYCFDGVVYAVTTSLGFAALENVLYVLQYGVSNALTRAVLSIPGHCIFGIFMGYYYGMAKYGAVHGFTAKSKQFLRLAIIVPMTLHGIYDFCLSTGSDIFIYIFLAYVVVLDIFAIRSIRKFSKSDTRLM